MKTNKIKFKGLALPELKNKACLYSAIIEQGDISHEICGIKEVAELSVWADWIALEKALMAAKQLHLDSVEIVSDSVAIVNQLKGTWTASTIVEKSLRTRIKSKMAKIEKTSVAWEASDQSMERLAWLRYLAMAKALQPFYKDYLKSLLVKDIHSMDGGWQVAEGQNRHHVSQNDGYYTCTCDDFKQINASGEANRMMPMLPCKHVSAIIDLATSYGRESSEIRYQEEIESDELRNFLASLVLIPSGSGAQPT